CFSSFDHSTCALSVSGRYLALEEIYLPFRAAFPNYSTRRRSFTEARRQTIRGSHPLWRPIPGDSVSASPKASSTNYNSGLGPDFKFELLPLHSPLLGQSLLVSFPPLIDMLKFSGYPCLIRGVPMSLLPKHPARTDGGRAGSLAARERQRVISRSATRRASAI